MKPEEMYQQLIALAEKRRITVSEKNLRQAGLRAHSGLCRVHGDWIYVMDKSASIARKVDLLAECLSQQPLDELYIVPAVREVIEKNRTKQTDGEPSSTEKSGPQDTSREETNTGEGAGQDNGSA
ncbi:MAG: hypothetical protein PVG78_12680 [Desulfobacterales bacterium]|jgi:hypothetical protein